jgi:hypothetical protein
MGGPDLRGQRFGRLVVEAESRKRGMRAWVCLCDCGVRKTCITNVLLTGNTKSCGCYRRDLGVVISTTHGGTGTPEHVAWRGLLSRCFSRRIGSRDWRDYAARGITVCDRWRYSFDNFLADMGKRPGPGYSIDRIDTNGNYTPENCRWATAVEQNRNKRSNRVIEHDGKRMTLVEWSEVTGISRELIYARIVRLGWTVERTLMTPAQKTKRSRRDQKRAA